MKLFNTWFGGEFTIPYNVFLHSINWTLDELKNLFINSVTDCFDGNISLSEINLQLFYSNTNISLSEINNIGKYDIIISFTDNSGNKIINKILNIIVDNEYPVIVYMPYVITSGLTGNTINYSGASSAITSGIYISSGFTFNLYYKDFIDRSDIINNIINYAYDYIDISVNKYMIDTLFFDNLSIYNNIDQTGEYYIKISLSDKSENITIYYFILNVIYDTNNPFVVYNIPENTINIYVSGTSFSFSGVDTTLPIIYYNYPISGVSWFGGGTTIPNSVFLPLNSGWTLNSLESLFINRVTDCFDGNIPLSAVTFLLYKGGSSIPLSSITEDGIYNIFISFTERKT